MATPAQAAGSSRYWTPKLKLKSNTPIFCTSGSRLVVLCFVRSHLGPQSCEVSLSHMKCRVYGLGIATGTFPISIGRRNQRGRRPPWSCPFPRYCLIKLRNLVHNANWLLTSIKSDPNLDASLPSPSPSSSTHLNHTRCDNIHSGKALASRILMKIYKCWGAPFSIPIPLHGNFPLLVLLLDSVLSNHFRVISAWRISSPDALCFVFELNPYPALVFEEEASLIIEVHCWFLHDHRSSGTCRE